MAKRILTTVKGLAWRYQKHPPTIEYCLKRKDWDFPKAVNNPRSQAFRLGELRDFDSGPSSNGTILLVKAEIRVAMVALRVTGARI